MLVECAQGVANFLRIQKNQETVLSSLLLRLLASLEFGVPVSFVDSFPKSLSPGLNSAVCGDQLLPSLYLSLIPGKAEESVAIITKTED